MDIERIHTYDDPRFPPHILKQHGAFLADGRPAYFEIVSERDAILYDAPVDCRELIDTFRFYAPHITRFTDPQEKQIAVFPDKEIFPLPLDAIQPSQFYADRDKLAAIADFVHAPSDIVIQVLRHGARYISLDGHTRLYYAVRNGWDTVRAVEEEADPYIFAFVEEAQKRHIFTPRDIVPLDHADYEREWNGYCDAFFAEREHAK